MGGFCQQQCFLWLKNVLDIHKAWKVLTLISQNEEGKDMLFGVNAKIKLLWAGHCEALVFSFTKRPICFDFFEALLSFLYILMCCHKSQKNSSIILWHHYPKIPFWGWWNTNCIYSSSLPSRLGLRELKESINTHITGGKLMTSAQIIFLKKSLVSLIINIITSTVWALQLKSQTLQENLELPQGLS